MRTERQRDKIINFLKRKGKASSLEMMQILNITSPHRRMFEINQMQDTLGFCIKSIKTKGKDGTKFNLYYLSAIKLQKIPELDLTIKSFKKYLKGLKKRFNLLSADEKLYNRYCSYKRGKSVSEHRGA